MEQLSSKYIPVICQLQETDCSALNTKKDCFLVPIIVHKCLIKYPVLPVLSHLENTIVQLIKSGENTIYRLSKIMLLEKTIISFILFNLVDKLIVADYGTLTVTNKIFYESKLGYCFYDTINKVFFDNFILFDEIYFQKTILQNDNKIYNLRINPKGFLKPLYINAIKVDSNAEYLKTDVKTFVELNDDIHQLENFPVYAVTYSFDSNKQLQTPIHGGISISELNL
jgi:hypothetical protein